MTDACRLTYPGQASVSQLINLGAPTGATPPEPLPPPDAELRCALAAADPVRIHGSAAAVLEHIADGLRWTRGMSIVRQRGDGSLGDRWPSVANALRKTDVDDAADQVTRSPLFRDLVAPAGVGSGRPVSTAEATRFGKAVVALVDRTRCAGCGEWWTASPVGASRWTCGCRSLIVVTRPSTR
jgi:hypothetical protein